MKLKGLWVVLCPLVLFAFSAASTFAQGGVAQPEQLSEFPMQEVVVTATRTPKESLLAPASVSVVGKERLEAKLPKTVDEALNDLPGVMVRRGKGLMDTRASVTLRGMGGQNRTLVLMDGMPLNTAYTGDVRFGGYFPEDLERVEVAKGPFSSLYGGYAMAGVVNFITRTPQEREFTLRVGYGSPFEADQGMKDLKRIYVSYGDKFKGLSFLVGYGRHDTRGYPTDFVTYTTVPPYLTGAKPTWDRYGNPTFILGHSGDNGWWDDGLTLKGQYELGKDTKFTFAFSRNRYEYSYEDPETYLTDIKTGAPVYHPRESSYLPGPGGWAQNRFAIGLETELFHRLKAKLSASYLDVDENWYVTVGTKAKIEGCPPGTKPEDCGYVSNTPQKALSLELQCSLPLSSKHLLTFGASHRWEYADTEEWYLTDWRDRDSTVKLKYESKGKATTYALFLQDEFAIRPNLTLYLGARQDFWRTYDGYVNQVGTSGYPKPYPSSSESTWSPKMSVVYKPFEGTVLRAAVGKAFRPPTVYELYRTWTSSRGITYAGNPDLKPEKVTSYEVGLSQNLWEGARLDLAFFLNELEDLIYRRTVTATYQDLINVGKAETRGVELGFEQRYPFGLRLFANLTYTHSEVLKNPAKPTTEGKRLTYIPLWMGNVGLEYRKGKFSIYAVGRYMDKWYSDDENRDKKSGVYGSYDEYFVVDARVSYQLSKHAELFLSLDNVFNTGYYYYYKAPGASWFAGLSVRF